MKRKPVTKTFVRQECSALGKKLREQWKEKLSRETELLAQKTQRSLKDIESRLTRPKATAKKK